MQNNVADLSAAENVSEEAPSPDVRKMVAVSLRTPSVAVDLIRDGVWRAFEESTGKTNLEQTLRRTTRTAANSCACGAFNVGDLASGEYRCGHTFHRRLDCLALDI